MTQSRKFTTILEVGSIGIEVEIDNAKKWNALRSSYAHMIAGIMENNIDIVRKAESEGADIGSLLRNVFVNPALMENLLPIVGSEHIPLLRELCDSEAAFQAVERRFHYRRHGVGFVVDLNKTKIMMRARLVHLTMQKIIEDSKSM